jgi:hypothetical protein
MTNLIAADWDSSELRIASGRIVSANLIISDLKQIPLSSDDPQLVSKLINEWVDENHINRSKCHLLIAIGRGKAELRQLSLPPVPEEELPALVRFQASQSLNIVSESASVDYICVEGSDRSTNVIAGGVSATTMKQISQIAEDTSLDLRCVVLRPSAAAVLYSIKADNSENPGDIVLVDLLADEIEIVIYRGKKIAFMRSVRMPQQTSGRINQIAGEVRRSLMACTTEPINPVTPKIIVWGRHDVHASDVSELQSVLPCSVQTLDPCTLVNIDKQVRTDEFQRLDTGRFASLFGLLLAHASMPSSTAQHPHPLLMDFKNPRRITEKRKSYKRQITFGFLGLSAAGILSFLSWSSLKERAQLVNRRESELKSLQPDVKKAEQSITRTELVDQFLDGNVIWLEQLRRLTDKMPPAKQVIVKTISAKSNVAAGGGQVILQAAAKSPGVVHEMEASIRDENHSVGGTGTNDLGEDQDYRWGFNHVISIEPSLVRKQRYDAIAELMERESTKSTNDAVNKIQTSEIEGDLSLEIREIDSLETRETYTTENLESPQQATGRPTPPTDLAPDVNRPSQPNATLSQQEAIRVDQSGNEASQGNDIEGGTE